VSEAVAPATRADRVDAPRALAGRVADRMNPVLVREVQQALNSRGFAVTLAIALLAVVIVALTAVADSDGARARGLQTLGTSLLVLAPIVLLIVPIQAFVATRQEVAAGTVEHLLLSRLTPARVVRGKLLGAVVQVVLYVAVFAPLLALTYQLRGIDVVTIANLLLVVLVGSLTACSLAVAGGAVCRTPQLQPVAFLLVFGGLVALAVFFTGSVGQATFFHGGRGAFSVLAPGLALAGAALVLFAMVGSSALAHPYENRSTGFRLFALAFVLLFPGWGVWVATGSGGLSRADLWQLARDMTMVVAPFWLLAATEEAALSPRVRTTVPKNPVLAVLATPFLPGGSRALLFVLFLAAAAMGGARLWEAGASPAFGHPLVRGHWGTASDVVARLLDETWLAWGYVVWYAGAGAWIRRRLARGPGRNWAARGFLLMVVGLPMIVPVVVDVATKEQVTRWHLGHVGNPFFTLDGDHVRHAFPIVAAAALTGLAANARAIVAGVAEVLRASRERRRRAA
jgi:hypothetical protein